MSVKFSDKFEQMDAEHRAQVLTRDVHADGTPRVGSAREWPSSFATRVNGHRSHGGQRSQRSKRAKFNA